MEFMEKKMSVFVNGLFVGSEIYPGVYQGGSTLC